MSGSFPGVDHNDVRQLAEALTRVLTPPACRFQPPPITEMPAVPPRLLHSSEQARELLGGISRTTLHRLIASGRLRAVRQGGRVYVTQADLQAYVAELQPVRCKGTRKRLRIGRCVFNRLQVLHEKGSR